LPDSLQFTNAALPTEKMLYSSESISGSTLGYWKFEARPDVLEDSSGGGRSLNRPAGAITRTLSPGQAALGDFCNALFNSSEFLYTE